ncbi:2-keto-4-pentenoate hydratase/2-oxohepta-3-ene-1,7-dioic acid hydratase in catechol pathway [Paraburkholderia bannensis]|uniref:2-keto-4-pentenoate hydratase/2-oxohepta-3-ene-1,7-dioic acid hydratase in catechol pathway n=1 Tax=Paraburkholderia bannensis TaxID=765414 RepID=A0A7W9U2P8_9BURK|nr:MULTISPECIES: fumarylacetoacetate hydrolase family protein [Paraburkholderia]MBB3259865.1 2-keto-4-pentenoate hydratase/2-oxohepta-3-ene-1,7-dioic acid hydratase in catechol pathway [Paraburkholderia sp. WP4_3_2]MBB6104825.1 2-keto-4-pentenoate hydratase/2-oxohepta-3-ene-1,7-dioic acid hydratase in catechol pathway [Paraburkholderia bannensis]
MTAPFSLVTYLSSARIPTAGILVRDKVYPVVEALTALISKTRPEYQSVLGILENWEAAVGEIATAVDALDFPIRGRELAGVPVSTVVLHSPVVNPAAVYGSGANYVDHMEEMSRVLGVPIQNPKASGQLPWHFVKTPRSALTGHRAHVQLPAYSTKLDWEIELAVIIGRQAKNISIESAMDYVAGYSVANDLSARDHVKRADAPADSPFAYDWVSQKCFDGSCPLGPSLVPSGFIEDPYNLGLKLWVNGELMQDSNTSNMIFNVAEQIAYLSSRTTLYPGDVILTGTPAGVGMAHRKFLKIGDVVRLEIEKIGVLENTIVK